MYQLQKMVFPPKKKKQTLDIGSLEKPDVYYSTMYMKDNLMWIILNKETPSGHAKSQLKDRHQDSKF